MPDPIYATNDGRAIHFSASGWVDARRSATANTATISNQEVSSIEVAHITAGRGEQWSISRLFLTFDTTSISVSPESAKLNIRGYYNGNLDVIALKSDYSPDGATLDIYDYGAITNAETPLTNSDGAGAGTLAGTSVVEYSDELTTWSTSGFNEIVLNADALSDIVSLDTFKVCVIDYDYDYLDIELGNGNTLRNGSYFSSKGGTTYDPYIDYTLAAVDNAVFFGCNF